MAQQIASMFGALGFKVDTTGLELFKMHLTGAKSDMANGARAANMLARKFRDLNAALTGVVNKLDRIAIRKANQNIAGSYKDVADSVALIDKALMKITNRQPTVTKVFGKIHSALNHGIPLWQRYLRSVRDVKIELADVQSRLSTLRQNSTIRIRTIGPPSSNSPTGGTDTRTGRPSGNPFQGGFGGFGGHNTGNAFGGGFFRSMLPSIALAGGLPTAGYAMKEVVQRGRAQQRMENILLFSSKGLEDFNDSLKYVRKEALRLGLDSAELGRAFAQVNMSTGDKLSTSEKKKMFTDMSEFIMTTGAGKEDQKLIFKAINQMFSLGRIQAEELNQLTERGIPRAMIYDTAMEIFGVKSHAEVMKLQEKGQLDPSKLLPEVFKRFAEKAHSSGAFDKMQQSSQTKQNIAVEKFNQLSQQIMDGGLDASLGKLFDLLSQLIDILTEITEGFKYAKKSVDEFTNGNSGLAAIILLLLPLILRKGKAIGAATRGLSLLSKLMHIFTAFLNGRFGQALLLLIKRFGLVGAAITGVLYLFKKLGEATKARETGEWTWVDTLGVKFEIAKLKMSNLIKRFILMKQLFGRTWDFWNWGDDKIIDRQAGATHSPKNTEIPMRGAWSDRQAQADKAVQKAKEIREKQSTLPPTIAAPNHPNSFEMKKSVSDILKGNPLSQNFNIYIDGVKQNDLRVSSELFG